MQISSNKNISVTNFTQTLQTKNNKEKFNSNTQYSYPRGILASSYGILLKKADKTAFKGRELRKASDVEKLLNKMGIKSSFKGSSLVADCSYKMVKVFERYFGKKLLPREINFLSFKKDAPYKKTDCTLGWFKPYSHKVEFNKDQDCYESKAKLKTSTIADRIMFYDSTPSYLSTFAHEMGHCAHYQRILDTSRTYSFASKCWNALYNKTVPKGIGNIMTIFKLGYYATGKDGGGLCEHMANRIARDVCNNYDSDYELYEGDENDLKYADIFDRKWGKLDPLHPQSYLDFYDQQIWNAGVGGYIGGDGEYHNLKIKEAEDKANEFVEMAEKIAKKEGIKVEDVDLYKVKELLNNTNINLEIKQTNTFNTKRQNILKLIEKPKQKSLEYLEAIKSYNILDNDDFEKQVFEQFRQIESMDNEEKALERANNLVCELSRHHHNFAFIYGERIMQQVASNSDDERDETSLMDKVSSWFSNKTPQQHQQERQQKHMLF